MSAAVPPAAVALPLKKRRAQWPASDAFSRTVPKAARVSHETSVANFGGSLGPDATTEAVASMLMSLLSAKPLQGAGLAGGVAAVAPGVQTLATPRAPKRKAHKPAQAAAAPAAGVAPYVVRPPPAAGFATAGPRSSPPPLAPPLPSMSSPAAPKTEAAEAAAATPQGPATLAPSTLAKPTKPMVPEVPDHHHLADLAAVDDESADEPGRFVCPFCVGPLAVWGGPRPSFCCVRCPANDGRPKRMVRAFARRRGGGPGSTVSVVQALGTLSAVGSGGKGAGPGARSAESASPPLEDLAALWAPLAPDAARAAAPSAAAPAPAAAAPIPAAAAPRRNELMVLTDAFVAAYGDAAPSHVVMLNEAAERLKVAKRRLYDVINVLEPLGVVTRTGKLTYMWQGTRALEPALEAVIKATDDEHVTAPPPIAGGESPPVEVSYLDAAGSGATSDSGEDSSAPDAASSVGRMKDPGHRSLWVLTQRFVRLMLAAKEPLPLPLIAKAIYAVDPGTRANTVGRRLYDVGSIFAAVGLVEKTVSGRRTPAFRWAQTVAPPVRPATP